MGIKFVDGSSLKVDNIVCVIYGAPNMGKTSLALTASRPALLDFDRGAHRAGNKEGKSILPINDWSDLRGMSASDFSRHDTIIVDTVGTCLDFLSYDIIANDSKCDRGGGSLTLNGFGVLKTRFRNFVSLLRKTMGKDIVFIAHLKEEQRGEEIVERIVATGSSKDEVYQTADIMGRLHLDGDRRVISFNPSTNGYGKNVGLPDVYLPSLDDDPNALATIIAQAKNNINSMQTAGAKPPPAQTTGTPAAKSKPANQPTEEERQKSWIESLKGNADIFNDAKEKLGANASVEIKQLLIEQANLHGVEFDYEGMMFLDTTEDSPW